VALKRAVGLYERERERERVSPEKGYCFEREQVLRKKSV